MENQITYQPLTQSLFTEAVELVFSANLDTREEIEHHLQHIDAHIVALYQNHVVGVIGWYQDTVHYADTAMGDNFPGEAAHWIGFFAVKDSFQGKGIGSQLLNVLEKEIIKLGNNELWVSSVPESKSYYESKGFQLVCEGIINNNQKFFMKKHIS